MIIRIGMENNNEKRSVAWLLDYPGCFAYGREAGEAVVLTPRALLSYQEWVARHTPQSWLAELGDFDVRIVEAFNCYTINDNFDLAAEGYEVNAFFRDDWKPLTAAEIERALQMLAWTRMDLLASIEGVPTEKLDAKQSGERWSIHAILNHLAGGEWWYLDRLGLGGLTRAELPKDPYLRLQVIRARLVSVLPTLAGVSQVVGREGELWSPRKLVRRALWHERDHWGHISRLVLEG